MARKKVNRFGYQWGGQKKQRIKRICIFLGLLVAVSAAGWFMYTPISNLLLERNEKNDEAVISPESVSEAEKENTEAPSEEVKEETKALEGKSYFVPAEILTNSEEFKLELSRLKEKGAKSIVFDLKDVDGIVRYNTAFETAKDNKAVAENTFSLEAVIQAVKAEGMEPVGRLFAFKDRTSTSTMYDAAVKYKDSKINWIDDYKEKGGKSWLNPNSKEAQDYIKGLISEAADRGLKTIIMEGMQFPTGYSLKMATYGEGEINKAQVLKAFYNDISALAEEKGAELIPAVYSDTLLGINDIPYGTTPDKVFGTDVMIANVSPMLYKNGVATEKITLSQPILYPYETVNTVLNAIKEKGLNDIRFVAQIQCYTAPVREDLENMEYTAEETALQAKAAADSGFEDVFYYGNPENY